MVGMGVEVIYDEVGGYCQVCLVGGYGQFVCSDDWVIFVFECFDVVLKFFELALVYVGCEQFIYGMLYSGKFLY